MAIGAFTVMVAASVFWAENVTDGASFSGFFLVTTLAALFVATYLPPQTMMRCADLGLKLVAVVSIALGLFVPSIGIESRSASYGSMTGIFTHKNLLASMLVFGLVTVLYTQPKRSARVRTLFWIAVYLYGIYRAESSTAIVSSLAVIVMFLVFRQWSQQKTTTRGSTIALTAAFGVVVVTLVMRFAEYALALIGRDLNFTGRPRIWRGSINAWQEHPILGWGWGSAFNDGDTAQRIIFGQAGWNVGSSHSGFVSVLVQLGVVGGTLAVLVVLHSLRTTFALMIRDFSPMHMWSAQMAVLFLLSNLFDTRFQGVSWFFLVIAVTHAAAHRRKANPKTSPATATDPFLHRIRIPH